MLTTVEKVIFLQDIDIFEFTSTEDLAHIAAITEEIGFKAEEVISKEGDIPDSMYMVIEGEVNSRAKVRSHDRKGKGCLWHLGSL